MKFLTRTLIFLAIILVAALLVPADLRTAYWHYGYATIIQKTGDPHGAADHFKAAFETLPDDILFARAYVSQLNDNGENFSEVSSFDEAYRISNNWITDYENDPEVWQMYVERARANWGRDRKPSAKSDIDKAVDLRPGDYIALVYQGIIWRDLNPQNLDGVRKAIQIFEQAIQVRNQKNTYWADLECAKAWYMVGDEGRALSEIDQAISQFPPRWIRDEALNLKHEIQSSGRTTH
jgi:hypothetical protein